MVNGQIVLMGVNEFRANCVPMDRELLGMIARQPVRVAILPMAAARQGPQQAARNGVDYFNGLGAQAYPVMALSRQDADDPQIVAMLNDADLIYLTGGDPAYLLANLRGSALFWAVLDRWRQGAMIVGSSAGAMVLGAAMRYGHRWTPTLGLAARVAILPHHNDAAFLALSLVGVPPTPSGAANTPTMIGVAEATGIVSADDPGATEMGTHWRVVGAGTVTVYTLPAPQRYHAGERFVIT